jgi:hypothetical protein
MEKDVQLVDYLENSLSGDCIFVGPKVLSISPSYSKHVSIPKAMVNSSITLKLLGSDVVITHTSTNIPRDPSLNSSLNVDRRSEYTWAKCNGASSSHACSLFCGFKQFKADPTVGPPSGLVSNDIWSSWFIGSGLGLNELQSGDILGVQKAPGRKRRKIVKSRGGGVSLVVGKYLHVSQIENMEGRAIIGKFSGKRVVKESLTSWMQYNWASIIGYALVMQLLSRGWINFLFRSMDDSW